MSISYKQLYEYSYGLSAYFTNGLFNFAGHKYLKMGMDLLEQAKDNDWNKDLMKQALSNFDRAGKIVKDETKIDAYLNASICCHFLKDDKKYLSYKAILEDLTFPEERKKYILKMRDDPTGFKTIYNVIRSHVTGEEYKNRYDKLNDAQELFLHNKENALDVLKNLEQASDEELQSQLEYAE